MGGVEFEGTVDPTDAEQWLELIERVFEQLQCSDAAKFKAKPLVLTWNDFVNEFHKKYVPPAYHDAKKKKFLNLEQGSMSIAEYQLKFLRLSRYAGGIINNEKDKCRIDKEQAGRNEHKFRKAYADSGGPPKRGRFDSSQANTFCKLAQHKKNRSSSFTASTPSYGQDKTHIPTCEGLSNPNPTFSLRMEASVQKSITTPSQGNKGARSINIQATSTGAANPAGGSRATARAYAMR
ncbi:uncharacterized protein LOC129890523 [Solanum dulcamara]|uniref:uncharacterized protein LOC129890523 n=1 Tax=Solanum dulcamara TaxID=45834 RepID=UPI002485268B|nr:uncharacterized protein LOC129890523 [Solanum dulcamara]